MGLIPQVEADDGAVVEIPGGQGGPVVDPRGFGIRGCVPEAIGLRAAPSFRAVVIQDNPKSDLSGIGHDFVQNLQGVQVHQVGINGTGGVVIADIRGYDGGVSILRRRSSDLEDKGEAGLERRGKTSIGRSRH